MRVDGQNEIQALRLLDDDTLDGIAMYIVWAKTYVDVQQASRCWSRCRAYLGDSEEMA